MASNSNINHTVLVGNLTRDVELKQTNSGTHVTELGIANNSSFKDSDGNWQSKPNYFTIVVWGKQAENCEKFLGKGSKIAVDGRLEFQSWESSEGGKNSRVVIVANNVEFLSGKKESSGGTADSGTADLPF